MKVCAGIVVVAFIVSAISMSSVPDSMATHWDLRGDADGYSDKMMGLFMLPGIMVFVLLLFLAVPRIDPLKENIAKFKREYEGMGVVMLLFLMLVHIHVITWNMGWMVLPNSILPAGLACLYIYIGHLLKHVKRNYFVGIKTPWTLHDERVWDSTHKVGARLFKYCGVIAFAGLFMGDSAILFAIAPAIGSTVYLFAYSYLQFKALNP